MLAKYNKYPLKNKIIMVRYFKSNTRTPLSILLGLWIGY